MTPSGREFEAVPQETLLAAALRAGLAPDHRCGNGSCGQCKARVAGGTVGVARAHDYRLSDTERRAGCVLMCCSCAASDLELEAVLATDADDIPEQGVETRVARLEPLGAEIVRVQLRTPRTRTLRFLAGQHARLEVPGLPARHKSIASCPCDGMYLDFHVRRAPDDPFAEHVFTGLHPGDAVRVTGPYGRFRLREDQGRPIVLLAYETGFPAIRSLIEQSLAIELAQPLHLYWGVRANGGHYLDNYCRAVADAAAHFRYTPLVGGEQPPPGMTPAQHDLVLAVRRILADHPDIAGFDVYASGPAANMAAAQALLLEHGLPPGQLCVDDPPRL